MSDELKSCPICGKQPEIIKCSGFDEAHCINDDCELSHTHVPINLSRLGWQSRPLEDALSAENAKLRGVLEVAKNTAKLQEGMNYEKALNQLYEIYKLAQEVLKNE